MRLVAFLFIAEIAAAVAVGAVVMVVVGLWQAALVVLCLSVLLLLPAVRRITFATLRDGGETVELAIHSYVFFEKRYLVPLSSIQSVWIKDPVDRETFDISVRCSAESGQPEVVLLIDVGVETVKRFAGRLSYLLKRPVGSDSGRWGFISYENDPPA